MFNLVPNLTWIRTFESAARLLSFTAAAEEIGMTQAAVSQQIKALEGKLGCDLFVRQHRSLTLTDMGQAYLPLVQRALKDLSLSTTGLFGPGFDNLVTVRASVSTTLYWLIPRMAQFRAEFPDTRVRLVSSHSGVASSGERVDVELRFGYGDWEGMQAEKIADERFVPICHPTQKDRFTKPEGFLTTALVHIIGFDDNWTRFFDASGLHGQIGAFGISVDTSAAAIDLVASGEGCAMVPERLANTAITSGRAIYLAGQSITSPQAHYAVVPHGTTGGSRHTDNFMDWLRREMH